MSWSGLYGGHWIAQGLGEPTHWHPRDVPAWPFYRFRRTTACGLPMYVDGSPYLRRPLYMRDLDIRDIADWPEDPNAKLPEHPWCSICFAAATGVLVPAATSLEASQ